MKQLLSWTQDLGLSSSVFSAEGLMAESISAVERLRPGSLGPGLWALSGEHGVPDQ